MRVVRLAVLILPLAGCASLSGSKQKPSDPRSPPTGGDSTVTATPPSRPADAPRAGPPSPAPAANAGPAQGVEPPVSGYADAPAGTAFVGDARDRLFYPMSCAAQHPIPRDHQIYFLSEVGAVRDGFTRSGDC